MRDVFGERWLGFARSVILGYGVIVRVIVRVMASVTVIVTLTATETEKVAVKIAVTVLTVNYNGFTYRSLVLIR